MRLACVLAVALLCLSTPGLSSRAGQASSVQPSALEPSIQFDSRTAAMRGVGLAAMDVDGFRPIMPNTGAACWAARYSVTPCKGICYAVWGDW